MAIISPKQRLLKHLLLYFINWVGIVGPLTSMVLLKTPLETVPAIALGYALSFIGVTVAAVARAPEHAANTP